MSANYNLFYFFKQFPDEEACRKYVTILFSALTRMFPKPTFAP